MYVDHIPSLNTARNVIHITDCHRILYSLCSSLSNVNLVKRWISTESESDWYAPCHDLWCGLCTFIMYVTILYQNEITWYISTLRCRWCKLISGLIFQEKYIGWKPVKYELKVSKLNSLDICYSKWKLVWFSFTRDIYRVKTYST